jgi:putative copper resistance protein D
LSIGLALQSALGVLEREAISRLRPGLLLCAAGIILFAALRLFTATAQMGDGSSVFDPTVFSLTWLALGPSTLALAAGAALAAAGALTKIRVLLLASAIIVSAGFALTGHSQALDDPGPAPIAVGAHVLIAGLWIAAPLTLFPRRSLSDQILHARLEAFSRLALAAIPLLAALGVWLAWRLTSGFATLLSETYGWLLLVKLAATMAAMGLGALNKQVITARVAVDPVTGRRWLRWTLTAEATLFTTAILAISAATTIAAPMH